jgi:hypothetical protein
LSSPELAVIGSRTSIAVEISLAKHSQDELIFG